MSLPAAGDRVSFMPDTSPQKQSERAPDTQHRRFDSLEQETFLQLWRTYDRLKAFEDEMFSRFELSAQQYNTLRLLKSAAPELLTVQGIGSRLISRAPDMTRLLDRLEERGLVQRTRRSDNRRVVDVGITADGIALLDQLAEPVRECHHRQLGHLAEPRLRQLVELLAAARHPHEDSDGPWTTRDV